jgi:deoxyribodipyrimidine photolyase-related protein
MALTLILGDQLHRTWLTPSLLQLAPGSRVLTIEDLAVASAYRYHRLRLLHTFVAMRSFRNALSARGVAGATSSCRHRSRARTAPAGALLVVPLRAG